MIENFEEKLKENGWIRCDKLTKRQKKKVQKQLPALELDSKTFVMETRTGWVVLQPKETND